MKLQERIAYLIVKKPEGKGICTKSVTKEVMKLMAILGGERLECGPTKHLVGKVPKDIIDAEEKAAFDRQNQDLTCWRDTKSCAVKDAEGNCRDTCELNWPIAYAQVPEQKFDKLLEKFNKMSPDRSSDDTISNKGRQWFYTYRNVIITIPLCANSFLDHGINQSLNSICQGQC